MFVGWIIYCGLDLLGFILDALMEQGGSGWIYEKFWLVSLFLASPVIFIGTMRYFLTIMPRLNKIILIIFAFIATFLQIIILIGILFIIAMMIIAPILARSGFYVTMP